MPSIDVSIIIPTYNDWERLSLCVEALFQQSYPREKYEVIIVNNNPVDETPNWFKLPEGFHIISEEKSGSYAARNKGLQIARGQIVGFTDSDCKPDMDWIKNAVTYLENNKTCKRIAGKISFYFKQEKPNDVELLDSLFSFNQDYYVKVHGMGVTGNMFSYKSVFDAIGNFNCKLMSGGDLEWGRRARAAGYLIHYVPSIIVKHPARSTFKELKSKARRVGGGHAQASTGRKASLVFVTWKLLLGLKPNVRETIFLYSQKKIGVKTKTNILLMRYNLQVIQALERFKVILGKAPSRF